MRAAWVDGVLVACASVAAGLALGWAMLPVPPVVAGVDDAWLGRGSADVYLCDRGGEDGEVVANVVSWTEPEHSPYGGRTAGRVWVGPPQPKELFYTQAWLGDCLVLGEHEGDRLVTSRDGKALVTLHRSYVCQGHLKDPGPRCDSVAGPF